MDSELFEEVIESAYDALPGGTTTSPEWIAEQFPRWKVPVFHGELRRKGYTKVIASGIWVPVLDEGDWTWVLVRGIVGTTVLIGFYKPGDAYDARGKVYPKRLAWTESDVLEMTYYEE
jgi:hypothetical protein